MLWLALLAQLAADGPPSHLYHVDLSRAAVATPEGRALRAHLESSRAAKQGRLQAERDRLLARRGRLSEAAFAARIGELNQRIEAAEKLLEAEQARGLDPIVARLDDSLAQLGALEPGARTVALEDAALIAPRRLCDRTGWLAEVTRNAHMKRPAAVGACKVRAVATVRVAEAMAKTRQAKARLQKIEKLQAERQAELDRFRTELTKLAATARETNDARMATEAAAQKRALDARFGRYQAEVANAERAAESTLRDAVETAVAKAQKAHPGVVFLELEPKAGPPAWAVGCDATAWLTAAIDGELAPLPAGCRAP